MAETTHHRIAIPTSWLQAIRLFAAKDDVRYYLNSVAITHGHLVATDGQVLGAIRDGRFDGIPETIIPNTALDDSLPRAKARTEATTIVEWERTETANDGVYGKGTLSLGNTYHAFALIEGRYPDFRLVLKPDHREPNGHPQFNLAQLARFGKAAEALGAAKGDGYKVHMIPDGERAVRVKLPCFPAFEGVVMPIRPEYLAKFSACL